MQYLVRFGLFCYLLVLMHALMAQAVIATGSVNNVTCNGGHNGSIAYHIQGGPGPIRYQWSNGSNGSATGSCTYAVHLNNTGASLSQFQIKVSVPLVTGMNANFSNVTFTDSLGNLLPFWLKDFPTVSNAIFWVKVPNVPTGISTIYLSYCGSQTTSLSNGNNTFEFFDNFDSGTFSQWYSVCDGIDQPGETCNAAADNTVYYSTGTSAKLNAHASCFSAPYDGAGTTIFRPVALLTDSMIVDYNDKAAIELYGFCGGGTSSTNSVQIDSYAGANGQSKGQGGSCAVNTGNWGDDSSKPFLATGADTIRLTTYGGDCSNSQGWFDDVRVRKYTANPPSVTLDTTPILTLDSLVAGTYVITLTDVNGGITHDTFTVAQPNVLIATNHTIAVSCKGQSNGTAWVSITGGTPSYHYTWSNAQTNDTIASLSAGNYIVTVKDSNQCTLVDTVNVTEPLLALSDSLFSKSVNCKGDSSGKAWANVFGGTLPYTYAWSNAATTDTAIHLPANLYKITITDANGCSVNDSITVTQPATSVSASVSTIAVKCNTRNTGSAWAIANGGTLPYTYRWNSGFTTDTLNSLSIGRYYVTVTDANGCTATANDTVLQTPSISLLKDTVTSSCINTPTGSASITVDSGTMPYHYRWSNGDTLPTVSLLSGGPITVSVTDANNCSLTRSYTVPFDTLKLGISASPDTLVVAGNSITLAVNGAGLATAVWSPSTSLSDFVGLTVTATPMQSTLYKVQATSLAGCIANDSIFITVSNKPGWFAPTAFTPNGDGHNDRFNIITIGTAQLMLLRVYNRWGNLVYEQQGAKPGWDGSYKGDSQSTDTFVYYAEILEDPNTGIKTTIKGTVALLR